jgi:N-methylhydantoinase A/oxoprolinase/acetone carboxylase beta subunit
MVDRPVVLGHELTGELGILERTVTAVLNAKLLPLTDDYLSRISDVLSSFGITAQVMVLKGDGHLMNLESARRRPVETILSGPAASVIGGGALSGHQDCLVVDIGSTSTDIAFLDKGSPRLNRYGAAVGSWRTRVQAIDVWTAGLGGDSMIDVDFYGNIRIGPERAIPLAITGRKYPELKRKMVELDAIDLLVLSSRGCDHLCKNERRVLKFIKEHGPSTLEEVAEGLIDLHFPKELVCELVQKRCLMVTGLTPTDVFHHRGLYSWGDLEASTEGISIAAARSRMDVDHFVERFMEKMTSRIAEEVLRKLYVDGTGEMLKAHEGDQLVSLLVGERKLCSTDLRLELDRPVVGLGAIADILVPTLESRFGARTFIPEHHEVGNAIGSVLSKVSETVKVQVMPTREGDYEIISSYIRYPIWDVNEALNRAKELASDLARIRAIEAGGTNVRISIDVEEKTFQSGFSGDLTNWIEVTAVAVGEPKGLG